jgi:hypothetical protein
MAKKNNTTSLDAPLVESLDEQLTISGKVQEELPEEYTTEGILIIPDEARNYYASQGYALHWIRIYSDANGTLDLQNIQKKEASKYSFVMRDEVPGLSETMSSFFKDKIKDNTYGLYVVGMVALAKVPVSRMKAKRQALDEMTRARSRAIIDDLRRNALLPNQMAGEKFETVRQQPRPRNVEFGK